MQTDEKEKLLYLMGVDWNWIYQRPRIIAEYLSNDFDVTVAYPVKIWSRRVSRAKSATKSLRFLKIWTFPFQRKNPLIGVAADRYKKWLLRNCNQYAYIYIDYPLYIECIPDNYNGRIIYDCIDDHVHMCPNAYMRTKVEKAEKELLQKGQVFIASSQKLLQNMQKQILAENINLIRNGVRFDKKHDVRDACVKKQYHIGYIGTVAEWFDKELINASVKNHSDLVYHIIGPCAASFMLHHDRIVCEGVVEHVQLYSYVKDYDCLIMPFLVNEITASADPVKLYEYIAFGKCIISVYYEELEHFQDYVYFYTTYKEYENLMAKLAGSGFPPKYSRQQQEKFLTENSWDARYELILKAVRG